jgi:hypothetical protein
MKSLKSILENQPLRLNQFSDAALMGEAVITDYSKFAAQHKKMYPSHSEEQIKAAWKKYSNAHSNKEAVANVNEEEDPVELVNAHLSDISEMIDDLYNTFSTIEEKIDEKIAKQIEKIYIMVDELYADVDNKYDIVIIDEPEIEIDDELEEQLQSLDEELDQEDVADFSNASLSTLKMIGFKRVKESDLAFREVNKLKKGKVRMLFGLPMRAGKWADVFVGTTMNKDKVFYFMHDVSLDDGDLGVFAKESQFLRDFKAMVGSSDIVEKLDPDSEAGVWIRDFIASKNPKFDGKSKKERIRMALGAWYGAQQNEK